MCTSRVAPKRSRVGQREAGGASRVEQRCFSQRLVAGEARPSWSPASPARAGPVAPERRGRGVGDVQKAVMKIVIVILKEIILIIITIIMIMIMITITTRGERV